MSLAVPVCETLSIRVVGSAGVWEEYVYCLSVITHVVGSAGGVMILSARVGLDMRFVSYTCRWQCRRVSYGVPSPGWTTHPWTRVLVRKSCVPANNPPDGLSSPVLRLQKVHANVNTIHELSVVMSIDFSKAVNEVHLSLSDHSAYSKNSQVIDVIAANTNDMGPLSLDFFRKTICQLHGKSLGKRLQLQIRQETPKVKVDLSSCGDHAQLVDPAKLARRQLREKRREKRANELELSYTGFLQQPCQHPIENIVLLLQVGILLQVKFLGHGSGSNEVTPSGKS
ncbi:unnamed protein product [Prunus armeniaca]